MTTSATPQRPSGPFLRAALAALLALCLGACGDDAPAPTADENRPAEDGATAETDGAQAGATVQGNTLEMTTVVVDPDEEQDDETGDGEPAADEPHMRGMVELSPEFAEYDGTRTLFVIVRVPDGPPMPRAVLRVDRPRFPLAFDIGPDQVVLNVDNPEDMLVGEFEIYARLDADGSAMAAPGDIESEAVPVTAGTDGIVLTIDRRR